MDFSSPAGSLEEENGLSKHWWENGQISRIETWEMGKRNGESKGWTDDGEIMANEVYKDDSLIYAEKIIDPYDMQQSFKALINAGYDSLSADSIVKTMYVKDTLNSKY